MKEKIELIEKSMEVKTREDKTEYTCFTDTAPEELKRIFLDHYEVRDINYQIFSKACDIIAEAWNNGENKYEDYMVFFREYVEENYSDFSSTYNADRLAYLTTWNDDEVAETFKDYSCEYISEACAIWYDEQVRSAMNIIMDDYLKIK